MVVQKPASHFVPCCVWFIPLFNSIYYVPPACKNPKGIQPFFLTLSGPSPWRRLPPVVLNFLPASILQNSPFSGLGSLN